MIDLLLFCLVVGVGSTIVIDFWALVPGRVLGFAPTNWGIVGRWLLGLAKGRFIVDQTNGASLGNTEKAIGWAFHYGVGFAYALMLPLFWGCSYIVLPTVPPVIVIGIIVSTLAGAMILMPGLGAGFMGSKLPNRWARLAYMVAGHSFFAAGQYGFARLFAGW